MKKQVKKILTTSVLSIGVLALFMELYIQTSGDYCLFSKTPSQRKAHAQWREDTAKYNAYLNDFYTNDSIACEKFYVDKGRKLDSIHGVYARKINEFNAKSAGYAKEALLLRDRIDCAFDNIEADSLFVQKQKCEQLSHYYRNLSQKESQECDKIWHSILENENYQCQIPLTRSAFLKTQSR